MNRFLLVCGGLLNTIFFIFHIQLGVSIRHMSGLPTPAMSLLQALNVAGTLFIFFFAYASFFYQKDVMTTGLGRGILISVAVLYLSRAAEEFFLFKFTPMVFTTCLLTGVIYAALWVLAARQSKVARAATAK